jgi:hypothetical protein
METISWTDGVKNEEFLHRVRDKRNVLHTVKQKKDNSIGYTLHRICLLKHDIEGKIEEKVKCIGKDEEEDVSSYCMTLRKS